MVSSTPVHCQPFRRSPNIRVAPTRTRTGRVAFIGPTSVSGRCFSPKYPKKILQLSETKLALRDTQKMMYALDLRAGSFKISRDEGVNLARLPVAEVLQEFSHPELVASTFSIENNRILPGITAKGPRVISFDAILKYNRYPFAQIIRDILDISIKDKTDGKNGTKPKKLSKKETEQMIATLTEKMKEAAKVLDFELAAALRDKIINLKKE